MKKAFVTGGTGFIGSHLVHKLNRQGFDVHVATHSEIKRRGLPQNVTIHACDIGDADSVRKTVEKIRPSQIFHLAASNIMSGVISSPKDVVRTNVIGTYNLLNAAEALPPDGFVIMGTFLEYGPKKTPVQEMDICEPSEIYSTSKLSATLLGQAAGRSKKIPVVIFRLFTPYGPGIQKGRLIRELVERALINETLNLTGKTVSRDFVYVDDICSLCVEGAERAKEHSGEIFNLGSGVSTKLEDLVAMILEKTNSKSIAKWNSLPQLSYDADIWQADMTKTYKAFAWRPSTSLSEGLDSTIASLQAT